MLNNTYKPNITWEKWINPYGENTEEISWSNYDNNEDELTYNGPQKINAIITPMGIIPYNEYTDCTKIFNFWIGHTNFSITQHVANLLDSIDGVETLDIFTRYRFRVAFGKAFNERVIINNINQIISNDTTIRTKTN